jgi:hypothetical protein
MTKNEIFRKFLQNEELRKLLDMSDVKIDKLDLYTKSNNKLLEVIRTVVLHTEDENSVDSSARKINQHFKNLTV